MKEKAKKLTLFTLTWPIFIEIFLYMLMGNLDTLMLSQYSDDSVAAVGVANQMLNIMIVMFGFVATGCSILVAQQLGAKNDRTAAEVAVISIVANFIFGLMLSGIFVFASTPLLKLMDLPPHLLSEGKSYLIIVGGFSFIQSVIMTLGAILRSYGFTKDTMLVTVGTNILHAIGNYFVIFGPFGFPVLGVEGVAFSTTISRLIGLIVLFYLLKKRIKETLPFKTFYKIPKVHLKNLLRIGIPSAGENLSYNASQIVITYFVTMIGTEALTTKVYTQNIMMFIYLFSVAISEGTQILIGHLIGARKYTEAYERCMRTFKIAITASTCMAIAFSFLAEPLLHIFTTNPHVIETGKILILLTVVLEPGRAFNLVIIGALRSAGDVKFPVYMGILSMWGISVTAAYFFGIVLGFGLPGIWIAFALDEWFRGIFMLFRWRSRIWEQKAFVIHPVG